MASPIVGGGGNLSALTKANVLAGQVDASPAGSVNAILKTLTIPITVLTTGEKDTGVNLPANCVVLDAYLFVRTAEATGGTKTIDVGLLSGEAGGDADGFADGISTAALGIVRPGAVLTAGGTEDYVSAITRGVMLMASGVSELGANVAGDVGTYVEAPYLSPAAYAAKSVTYTLGSAHTELDADIVLVYMELA